MRIEIELTFNRQNFEDLYFEKGGKSYLTSNAMKPFTKRLAASFVIFSLSIYALYTYQKNYALILTGGYFLVSLFYYTRAFIRFYTYKQSVKNFLDREEKYTRHYITLTENSFCLAQDDNVIIERLSNLLSVVISSDSILVHGQENYMIPRSAVSAGEYKTLKDFFSKKLQGEDKVSYDI